VLLASAADGWNVAVVPAAFNDTVPDTSAPLPLARRVKVAVLTLETASLKVAVTAVPGLTFVAPFAGAVELIAGGVVSAGADTVTDTEGDLSSPWVAPVLFVFPNHAAAYAYEPGVDGAGVVKVIGNSAQIGRAHV